MSKEYLNSFDNGSAGECIDVKLNSMGFLRVTDDMNFGGIVRISDISSIVTTEDEKITKYVKGQKETDYIEFSEVKAASGKVIAIADRPMEDLINELFIYYGGVNGRTS